MQQQLDKAVAVLDHWQQSYQLHVAYLQAHTKQAVLPAEQPPLLDPLLELDHHIQQIMWPDPLLAYAILDQSNRVLRFSSSQASLYFSQTRMLPNSQQTFLAPMVFAEQWVIPLKLQQAQHVLLLWFDAAKLQHQIQQVMRNLHDRGELLLLDQAAELFSRSRYQQPLQARFGQDTMDPQRLIQIFAKRPPEHLLFSNQRYLNASAWPTTAIVQQIRNKESGFLSHPYPNYLGRPTLAAWQFFSPWQLFAVVERDATYVLADKALLKQKLLAILVVISVLLTGFFWFLQRRIALGQHKQSDVPPEAFTEAATYHTAEPLVMQAADGNGSAVLPAPMLPPAVSALLQAWLQQRDADPALADVSRYWLAHQPTQGEDVHWVCPLRLALGEWLQQWQRNHDVPLCCYFAPTLPTLIQFDQPRNLALLDALLQLAAARLGQTGLRMTVSLSSEQLLVAELTDDATRVPTAYWQQWLAGDFSHSSGQDVFTGLSAEQISALFQQIKLLLSETAGRIEVATGLQGNSLQWQIPVQVPSQLPAELLSLQGRAMLLCPTGVEQQAYQQLLQSAGLELLPLDDSQQLLEWCSTHALPLDFLLIDEHFVKLDAHLAVKVAHVVQRYFPAVQIYLAVTQPERWELAAKELCILPKPVHGLLLQHAQSMRFGVVHLRKPTVWIYLADRLELWWLEQMCQQLTVDVQLIESWPQLPGDLQHDCYCLPASANTESLLHEVPRHVLWVHSHPYTSDASEVFQHWSLNSGPAVLSQQLYRVLLAAQSARPSSKSVSELADESITS